MSTSVSKASSVEFRLLLSRALTRSGDQAWDFVIPFALLHVFPGKLQIAAFYYLVIKLGTFLMTPFVGKWIDLSRRIVIIKGGVWIQFVAVLGGAVCFYIYDRRGIDIKESLSLANISWFFLVCIFGTLASLGSTITDIAVGNDLAPTLIPSERLTVFNSWLRRIDLTTEVFAPIVAGLLFTLSFKSVALSGLFIVALWNLISFIPEYFLLSGIVKNSLVNEKIRSVSKSWKDMFQINLRHSFLHPVFWLIASYALLWLSVLSPHGVLLSGYLKDMMKLPESEIGVFRGLGAIFGLISTLTFPYFVKKWGLISSSKIHLSFQGVVLLLALFAFQSESAIGIYSFLACILLSRIGLYGFSNGEFELRQRLILEGQRGEVNAFSYLATTFATLLLFGAGSLLSSTEDFKILVYISVLAVVAANLIFYRWARTQKL